MSVAVIDAVRVFGSGNDCVNVFDSDCSFERVRVDVSLDDRVALWLNVIVAITLRVDVGRVEIDCVTVTVAREADTVREAV